MRREHELNDQKASIIAIVTTAEKYIKGGGAPIFIVDNEEQLEEVSKDLEKIMDAAAHQLNPNTMLLVAR